MTIDEMIAVLQAAKDGKRIQCRDLGSHKWDYGYYRGDGRMPLNFSDYDYRVKPEPREWWICFNPDGRKYVYEVKQTGSGFEQVKVREVLE